MGDSARDLNTVRKEDSREVGTWIFLYCATEGFMEAFGVQPIIRQVTKKMVNWQITNLNTELQLHLHWECFIDFLNIDFQIFSSQIFYSSLAMLGQGVLAGHLADPTELHGDPPVREGHPGPP